MMERQVSTQEVFTSAETLRQAFLREILERLDCSQEIADRDVLQLIDEVLLDRKRTGALSLPERQRLRRELFYELRRLGIVQELLDDDQVTEIMINGTSHIFYEKAGRIREWGKRFSSKKKLEDVIQQIVSKTNRRVNEASPIVDTRLEGGERVNVVMAPVALDGPVVTIRRFPDRPIDMEDLLKFGSLTASCAAFLQKLVAARYNIFISGGTGSGKTTFLNVLSAYIPAQSRVITIEDCAELQLQSLPNLVRLEARQKDVQGENAITIRDLIRTALRMRPDRIIVGEVRGEEAIDMLQAFNTGHDGSLSTGHANSPADMLSRLETMVLMGMDIPIAAIRRQIASGIDVLIHLGRIRDRSRKVLQIAEVTGYTEGAVQLAPLYVFEESGTDAYGNVQGKLRKVGKLLHCGKMHAAGITDWEEDERNAERSGQAAKPQTDRSSESGSH